MTEFTLVPARTALIDVDMQICFVEGTPLSAPDGRTVLGRVERIAAACRAAGMPVVHTRMTARPDRAGIGLVGEVSPPFITDLFTAGNPTAVLHPELTVAPTDLVVDKPRYGAFHGTDLELVLRDRGVDSVVITGIATNICCETTAREAAVRDFRVFFVSDATATLDMNGVAAADLQRATCAGLGMVFAQVLTTDDLMSRLTVRVGA